MIIHVFDEIMTADCQVIDRSIFQLYIAEYHRTVKRSTERGYFFAVLKWRPVAVLDSYCSQQNHWPQNAFPALPTVSG